MRYYQNRQFEMLRNVSLLLKKHKADLSVNVPLLEGIIDDFVEWTEHLFRLKFGNMSAPTISAGQKRTIRTGLEDATLKLTGVLRVHHYKNRRMKVAKDSDNVANESVSKTTLTNYTVSDLKKATADKLYTISALVIQEVKKIKPLRHYGLTADDIKKAEHCFEEFAKMKDAPAQSKKETASRNEELAMGVKEGIANLENVIDPLMRIATEGDKELYLNYKGFRKVMPKGRGRISEQEARYRRSRKRKKG